MKKYLVLTIAIFALISCSKSVEKKSKVVPEKPINVIDELTKLYGVDFEKFDMFDQVDTDTSLVGFYGLENEKIWVGIFKKQDKQVLLNWNSTIADTIKNFVEFVGEKSYKIQKGKWLTYYFIEKGTGIIQMIENVEGNNQINLFDRETIFFVKNNQTNSKKENRSITTISEFFPWYDGNINILQKNSGFEIYTKEGVLIYKNELSKNAIYNPVSAKDSSVYFINNEIGIVFSGDIIRKLDYKNFKTEWEQIIKYNTKGENIRIGKVSKVRKGNDLEYEITHTLSSGANQILKFKINIETGELQYL